MKAKRQVQQQLKRDYRRYKRRVAGILGDYSGTVDVPNRTGYVFVRLRNQEVKEAFNKRVPSLVDLPVWVGYSDDPGEPQILQVLDTRTGVERQKGEDPIGLFIPAHHETHEWFNPLGGQDVVFSDKRQFMPFRPTPIGGMLLHVYRNVGWLNGEYTFFSGSSIDLSPYVPATGAYFGLVYEDTDATLSFSSGTGDFLKNAFTLTLADIPNPTPGTYPIAAVRMWGGMTGIVEALDRTDLIDLRFPFTQNFLLLSDVPWSYTGSASQLVAVKSDETGLEFISSAGITGSSPSTFLGLTDTPSSYSGQSDKLVVVNTAENALEFRDNTGTSGGGGYDTVQDEGSGLTQQDTINFVGGGVEAVNDPANNRTTIRIPGTVSVFDDGVFQVSGTALDFMDNLDVAVTGTHVFISGQAGGGETGTFIGLTDTPETYLGFSGSFVAVNEDQDGLVFVSGVSIASDDANITAVNFLEQVSDPPIPGTNHRIVYAKSDGIYERNAAGVITGPLCDDCGGGSGLSSNGWTSVTGTWSYASADDPTFTFTESGDQTGIYSAGMRVRISQSTGGTKYFIITNVSYSAPDTTVTIYGGTDYDLNNEAINNPHYSVAKAPQGFPLDPTKWTVQVSDTTNRSQAPPTQNVWYNLGSITISIPIGIWRVYYQVASAVEDTPASGISVYTTLSTANNSESDVDFTARIVQSTSAFFSVTLFREKVLVLSSKTSYFLNTKTGETGVTVIYNLNASSKLFIRAVCAYL